MMISEVHAAVGGQLFSDDDSPNRYVTGFTWDSRQVTEGDLFLAMPGERVDGNDFIVKAIAAGAGAVICTKEQDSSVKAIAGEFACPLITVQDGQEALNLLASYWRDKLRCLVIGITGSTGKTSTKDLLRSVLSQRYNVTATQGNHNNELGVPLTMLSAEDDCEILILEMGMRGRGQIEHLCSIARPSIGLVTNVGVCHMELLGSREEIARAKGELIAALPPTGLAVVNGDNDMTDFMLDDSMAYGHGIRVCRFGSTEDAFARALDVTFDDSAHASFNLALGRKDPFPVTLGLPGEHNVSNALSVACVADHLGVTPEQIAAGLASAGGSGMRMEVSVTAGGVTIINDAYNANPDSMRASLSTLGSMACSGRRIAVLGDMGELGVDEVQLHQQTGAFAAGKGIDLLICVGELAKEIAQGAIAAGMDAAKVVSVDDIQEACARLENEMVQGDVVLVKASRFMGLERIVKEILE